MDAAVIRWVVEQTLARPLAAGVAAEAALGAAAALSRSAHLQAITTRIRVTMPPMHAAPTMRPMARAERLHCVE